MSNYTPTQLKYETINQRSMPTEPLLSMSKSYTVRDVEVPLSELYTSIHRTVSGREFFNYTKLRNVCILDGGTGEKRYIPSSGSYSVNETVVIRTSLSAKGEHIRVQQGALSSVTRKAKEYIINAIDLKEKPIYIHELNLIITVEGNDKNYDIPNLENELKRLNERIFKQAMHMYEHPAYAPYLIIPSDYKGTKIFYFVINEEICQLPFIEIDPNITDKIHLCLNRRDPVYGSMIEDQIPIDLQKLFKEHKIIHNDKEYLFSTNRAVLQSILERKQENELLKKIEFEKLQNTIKQLQEENKRLLEEIAQERAKYNTLINDRRVEYDNRKLDHDYTKLEHDERNMQTKEQIEAAKLKNEQDKWKSDVAKIAIGAITGAIIIPLVKIFGTALLDVITKGGKDDN